VGAPISGRLVAAYGTRPSLLIAGSGMIASALILAGLTATTPLAVLLGVYVIFGAGFAVVNIPITHTAVSGMPNSQAGVAAAIASTSRQVGATLGIAVAGTITSARQAAGLDFARATHPVWWIIAAAGSSIALLGWASHTAWAKESARRVAHLLADPPAA
jgi:MFS family permease